MNANPPVGHMIAGRSDRSVGELLGELASEVGTLVKKETRLAAEEMSNKASYAAKQGALVAVGALIGTVSLLVLVSALVLALANVMAPWAAALVVGVVVGAISSILISKGVVALKKMDPRPVQTLQSIKETKSWAYENVK